MICEPGWGRPGCVVSADRAVVAGCRGRRELLDRRAAERCKLLGRPGPRGRCRRKPLHGAQDAQEGFALQMTMLQGKEGEG